MACQCLNRFRKVSVESGTCSYGAGSPTAQKIMIARRSGIDQKMELAKTIAGINQDPYFERIIGKDESTHWNEIRIKMLTRLP
jgi:hypothetical protein